MKEDCGPADAGLPRSASDSEPRIAVLIPCYNEEGAVEGVVTDFRSTLPSATIFVYDNNSSDRTAARAQSAGAVVRSELRQGKGHVVRRMFADIEADVYVLVDGDQTYDAAAAPGMVAKLLSDRLDMVNAARVETASAAYRTGHRFGNRILTGIVQWLFGRHFRDMLSGYRVFSRRFVKSFPAMAAGFEIETELTVHALELCLPVAEVRTPYFERPAGTASKLNSVRDGFRILWMIAALFRYERPFVTFATIGAVAMTLAGVLVTPVLLEYASTGEVARLPSFLAACTLGLAAVISAFSGAILEATARGRKEFKRLLYLSYPAPGADPREA